ncbi:MAG: SUMF1/EgtB/PvdO family nonheme iron enzyme [Pseudomonadota bacterium]
MAAVIGAAVGVSVRPTFASGAGEACADCPALVALPTGIAMSRAEINFDQWWACVRDGGCAGGQDDHGWGRGTRPVINVTWEDAGRYAAWLGRRLGRACRLPTEAEWEVAAAAGTATRFWWGDEPGRGLANCRDCGPAPVYGTLPSGTFPANPWGLVDMNGNVWEWTADCWTPGQTPCRHRVIKGGSWYYYSPNAEPRARAKNDARLGSYNIGIRVVCE